MDGKPFFGWSETELIGIETINKYSTHIFLFLGMATFPLSTTLPILHYFTSGKQRLSTTTKLFSRSVPEVQPTGIPIPHNGSLPAAFPCWIGTYSKTILSWSNNSLTILLTIFAEAQPGSFSPSTIWNWRGNFWATGIFSWYSSIINFAFLFINVCKKCNSKIQREPLHSEHVRSKAIWNDIWILQKQFITSKTP